MEYAVEDTVCNKAEAAGWLVRKVVWVGRRGAPDRLFGKSGRHVFIEFKDKGEEPRMNQIREHKKLRDAGFEVHVCDTVSGALKILGIEGSGVGN